MSEEEKKEMIELITPQKTDKDYEEEIERLQNIIKEVREYIEKNSAFFNDVEWELFNKREIYEILNKGDDKE